ncbi:hypothetical protein GS508_25350 [Rhodococcus hoagii]|nr:hypothetical protein [Prescottella equi]
MTHTTEYPTRYMRDRARAARTTAPLRPFAWPSPDATESEARHCAGRCSSATSPAPRW